MASSYPSLLDVFMRLADEFDRLTATQLNAMLDAPSKIQAELGADPYTFTGTIWQSYSDVADVVERISRMEAGEFEVELPSDDPVYVEFKNPSRFTEAGDMIILIQVDRPGKSRKVWDNWDESVELVPASGSPTGFNYHRKGLTNESNNGKSFTVRYLAIEDDL